MLSENSLDKYNSLLERSFRFLETRLTLVILGLFIISLAVRLALTPFSLVLVKDAYRYLIKSMEITSGNFTPISIHALGWSLFMAPFFYFFWSSSLLQNMVYARIISDILGALLIFPLALIGNKLFNKRLLILLLILFSFSSPLIISATAALSEPLFTFLLLVTIYFIIKTKEQQKYILFAAGFGAIASSVRSAGILILFMIFSSFYMLRKQIPKFKYTCFFYILLIYFIISAPHFYQRYYYFNSPFSYGVNNKFLVDTHDQIWSLNISTPSFLDYLRTHTLGDYLNKFIVFGLFKIVGKYVYYVISPVLLLFFIYGIIRYAGTKKFLPISIGLAVWIIGYIPVYQIHGSPRHLYPTIPFLLIFSTVGLYEILNFHKYKSILISLFTGIYILFSLISPFGEWYKAKTDPINDGLIWGKWIAEHVQGKIAMIEGDDLIMLNFPDTRVGGITDCIVEAPKSKVSIIRPGYFSRLDAAMRWWKQMGVTHLVLDDLNIDRYPYLKEIYSGPAIPDYLTEIYSNYQSDSQWKIRVFAIDWSKFEVT